MTVDAPAGPAAPAGSKHERMLEAARAVFLRDGYGGASMDAIAAEAGVSKRTVYNHFGSKEALFATIIRAGCDRFVGAMGLPDPDGTRGPGDLHAVLSGLARQFLALILRPETLDLHRALIGEASRQPDLGRMTYEAGPARAVAALAGYLERRGAAEPKAGGAALRIVDARLAAEQFFGMVLGHFQLRALLGVEARPDDARLDAAVEAAVSAFIRAHRH